MNIIILDSIFVVQSWLFALLLHAVGDMMIVNNVNHPRRLLKLGRVIELSEGSDGNVTELLV